MDARNNGLYMYIPNKKEMAMEQLTQTVNKDVVDNLLSSPRPKLYLKALITQWCALFKATTLSEYDAELQRFKLMRFCFLQNGRRMPWKMTPPEFGTWDKEKVRKIRQMWDSRDGEEITLNNKIECPRNLNQDAILLIMKCFSVAKQPISRSFCMCGVQACLEMWNIEFLMHILMAKLLQPKSKSEFQRCSQLWDLYGNLFKLVFTLNRNPRMPSRFVELQNQKEWILG